MDLEAVLLDWRGTLAAYLTVEQWFAEAFILTGRDADDKGLLRGAMSAVERVLNAGPPDGWDRMDTSAELHRRLYDELFRRAGLEEDLARALYAVESDVERDVMASDVPRTLNSLASAGVRVVIVSDIHVDLRPWFARRGLADRVHGYVLSYEIGAQKPDPAIFEAALAVARTTAGRALMVGDRAAYDGAAVAVGIPTLLVPPLTGASHERLHLVTAHVPAAARAMGPTVSR